METMTYPYFKDITDKKNYDLFVSRIKRSFDKDNLNPEIYQIKKQIQEKYKEPKKDEVSAEKMEELSKKIAEIRGQISFPKYIKVITKEDAQKNIEEYNKFSNAELLIKLQELELEKKLLPYKSDQKLLSIKKERYLNLLTLQKLIMNQRKWAWDFMVTGINKPNFLQEIKDKRAELVIYNKEDTAKWNEIKKDTLRIANQVPNDIADIIAEIIYDIVYVGIRSNAKRIGPGDIFDSSFPIEKTHMYPLFSKLPSFTKEIKTDEDTEIEKNNLFTHSIQYILHGVKGKGVRFSNKFYTFLNNLIIDFLSYVSDFSKIALHRYIGNNIGLTVSREIVRNAILLLLGPKNKYILDTVLSPLVKKERKKEKVKKEVKEVKDVKEAKEVKEVNEVKDAKEVKEAAVVPKKETVEAKEVTKVARGSKKETKDINKNGVPRTGTIIRS